MAGTKNVQLPLLLLLCLVQANNAVQEDGSVRQACPAPSLIRPCVCTEGIDFEMDMHCSLVTSSNQLAYIFNSDYPFKDFRAFYLRNNPAISVLRVGDFGTATFQEMYITGCSIDTVMPSSLEGSYSTLVKLDLQYNVMDTFPFDEIASFQVLTSLNFEFNRLSSLPSITSGSLKQLLLGGNPLGVINPGALNNVLNLEEVCFHDTGISSVPTGTFDLPKLKLIHLEDNPLITNIEMGTFLLSAEGAEVHLYNTGLTTVAVNGIIGATEVWAFDAAMEEVPEDVWSPLFKDNFLLRLEGNDLICGCDIAWIVVDVTKLVHISPSTTCRNGIRVWDLDPAQYTSSCYQE